MNLAIGSVPVDPLASEPLLIEPAQAFLLHNLSWEEYSAIGNALAEKGNLRLTYDEGRLEFMSVSQIHEMLKSLLMTLISILMEELDLPGNPFGQMTLGRQDLAAGLEPDACYYLQNWEKVRHFEQIDLNRDPPPDLALEIDITSSSIKRLPLYEKLRIPELWRFEGNAIHVYVLNAEGHYETAARSPTFPMIPLEELVAHAQKGIKEGNNVMSRAFRERVRQLLSANGS